MSAWRPGGERPPRDLLGLTPQVGVGVERDLRRGVAEGFWPEFDGVGALCLARHRSSSASQRPTHSSNSPSSTASSPAKHSEPTVMTHLPVIVLELRMNPNASRLVDPYAASTCRAIRDR